MKSSKTTRKNIREFIESPTARSINSLIEELDNYIRGGNKQLREAYGHIPKPKPRKIKDSCTRSRLHLAQGLAI